MPNFAVDSNGQARAGEHDTCSYFPIYQTFPSNTHPCYIAPPEEVGLHKVFITLKLTSLVKFAVHTNSKFQWTDWTFSWADTVFITVNIDPLAKVGHFEAPSKK
jgi:hypothetical protein